MEKVTRPPQFQYLLSFFITERCNLRCKHCIASAEANGRDMALADLRRWLEEAAAIDRVKTVCMTGGEPFVVYDTLQRAINCATSLGLKTTVVTNGFWASSMERAVRTLEGVSALTHLALSLDSYHLQFIPLETLKTAIRATSEVGIKATVRVSYLTDEEREVAEAKRLLDDVLELVDIMPQPIIRAGRAASELAGEQFHSFTYEAPCVNASRPVVAPDGMVYACCGPASALKNPNPLWLGDANASSLTSVLEEAQYNVTLQIIRTKGPYHLWSLVRDGNGDLQRYDTTNLCSLCMSLMSDPGFVRELESIVQDPKLLRKIAIERFFLLQEPAMLTGLRSRVKG